MKVKGQATVLVPIELRVEQNVGLVFLYKNRAVWLIVSVSPLTSRLKMVYG